MISALVKERLYDSGVLGVAVHTVGNLVSVLLMKKRCATTDIPGALHSYPALIDYEVAKVKWQCGEPRLRTVYSARGEWENRGGGEAFTAWLGLSGSSTDRVEFRLGAITAQSSWTDKSSCIDIPPIVTFAVPAISCDTVTISRRMHFPPFSTPKLAAGAELVEELAWVDAKGTRNSAPRGSISGLFFDIIDGILGSDLWIVMNRGGIGKYLWGFRFRGNSLSLSSLRGFPTDGWRSVVDLTVNGYYSVPLESFDS
ncbi:unnamed protein product [Fusarium graminearum]|uniref:Chromosome 1, complete genome n=2 Tax=Gibberella zeae TaxID=5518 RepID=I1S4L7_GIBZE|nr:hypothetical protein FGSG_11785 [Fusarium graminearum PH-1]CAF3550575.1 unnamed protein product [Fusarium graminearum]ESU05772.1 hypothetical protein FGSG_11785 [Fusarium graminearum PH-1]CAF3580608.1 unnamed protein product [Fusarium graminearum]CAG2004449.1 unnamed protein product [Fusarium graminearum]CAG2015498.1 unnamed protein product [Fusarium graminearum]|eukprot:XP_011316257.1 hypothetical protein FGSG_11785 [Fusarium graminearum PH-1]